MRNILVAVAGVLVISLAPSAEAGSPVAKGAPAARLPTAPQKSGRLLTWLSTRFRTVAKKIKKVVGPANWARLHHFWKTSVRDRVAPGAGRRMRAFIEVARRFGHAVRTGKLSNFLEKATRRWGKKPLAKATSPVAR